MNNQSALSLGRCVFHCCSHNWIATTRRKLTLYITLKLFLTQNVKLLRLLIEQQETTVLT